ncbi:phospholipase A1-like [Chrysoperla carnea]|uniref:phospholipase A1-like n=1 Tax=Chrysoperla carnea TaxID=189513 RepID=UPI001D086B18|nr:phospholipase A1-like [Chrysoperla carnea]
MCIIRNILLFFIVFGEYGGIFMKTFTINLELYNNNFSGKYKMQISSRNNTLNKKILKDAPIDIRCPLEILLHGYQEKSMGMDMLWAGTAMGDGWITKWTEKIKDGLLQKTCNNVLIVHWDKYAKGDFQKIIKSNLRNIKTHFSRYHSFTTNECGALTNEWRNHQMLYLQEYNKVIDNARKIAKFLGKFLSYLPKLKRFNIKDIRIRGFSLGAHLAGFIGKEINMKTGKKVGRITGLDPTGPLFYSLSADNRLDKGDALFTDVIHTNGALFGIYEPIGHANFYPNNGCGMKEKSRISDFKRMDIIGELLTSTYSHYKATQYFFESIDSDEFLSTPCDSYKNFEEGKCNGNQVFMGYNVNTTLASGNYYLDIKDDKEPDFGL